MNTEFVDATRKGICPLIVIYAESGCGKTYSALVLARGMAGPSGKIAMIDSEAGRGSIYADVAMFGGYKVKNIEEPFSPQTYINAINQAESGGFTVGIIDSGSHEWEGVGGVLDMAAAIEQEKGKSLANWKGPKSEHAKFVQRLMRSKMPWIVCLRAKYKTRQIYDEKQQKKVVVKDDYTTPIQSEEFIYEATCHGEIMPNHALRLTKWSHPDLKKCLPDGAPIELSHGEMIAKWCTSGGVAPVAKKPKESFKSKFWTMTSKIHGGDKVKLTTYLQNNGFLGEQIALESLGEHEFENLCGLAEKFV